MVGPHPRVSGAPGSDRAGYGDEQRATNSQNATSSSGTSDPLWRPQGDREVGKPQCSASTLLLLFLLSRWTSGRELQPTCRPSPSCPRLCMAYTRPCARCLSSCASRTPAFPASCKTSARSPSPILSLATFSPLATSPVGHRRHSTTSAHCASQA